MGKIGRCASNEVTVSLIKAKCLHTLLYGTAAYHFSVRETASLKYPISCALMTVFNRKLSEILENCELAFWFRPFSLSVAIRKRHFYNKYATTYNALCQAITAFTLSSDYVTNEAALIYVSNYYVIFRFYRHMPLVIYCNFMYL